MGQIACNDKECPQGCLHGGTCKNGICNCPEGYAGVSCEIKLNPCYALGCDTLHSTCDTTGSSPFCVCNDGWEGENCDKNWVDKYLGLYVNKDSIYLNVSKRMIAEESFFKFRIHKNSLDSLSNELIKINGKYKFKNETTFLEDKIMEFIKRRIDSIQINTPEKLKQKILVEVKEIIATATVIITQQLIQLF